MGVGWPAMMNGATPLKFTLPETNSSPLKMDAWNTTFLLGFGLFSGDMLVSGRVTRLPFFGN